jgi:uncharacterized damage-inducible protein DinB
MAQSQVEQYRRWFEYEKDSHRKVLASFETVPQDQRWSPPFQKALSIMAHIVVARRMWLFRFGLATERPATFFPTDVRLDELSTSLEAMERGWADYLRDLTEAELSRVFEYESTDAGWCRSVVEDILTQLFGHSWYHRGQIASLVKAAGGQPAVTDFVYWSRERIASPKSSQSQGT